MTTLEKKRFLDRGRVADIGVMNGIAYSISRVDYDDKVVYLLMDGQEITAQDHTIFYTEVVI